MTMRKIALPLITVTSVLLSYAHADESRYVVNQNLGWEFHAGDMAPEQADTLSSQAWRTVNLPHDFLIEQDWVEPSAEEMPDLDNPVANIRSRLSARGFKEMGTGWYRKDLFIPAEWQGRCIILDFEGIMLVGDVWVNGKHVGGTDYGYLGFEIDLTPHINYNTGNSILVKADTGAPENSRWYTGGGLYRDVNLIVSNAATYFPRHPFYITTPEVSQEKALVKIFAEVAHSPAANDTLQVDLTIRDNSGNKIARTRRTVVARARRDVEQHYIDSITIDSPLLWDCDSPHLYTAEFNLRNSSGEQVDQAAETFGIRKIEYSPEFGLKLNGRKVLLKGIANRHTLGALGAAAYPRAIEKRIQLLKEFGFNHIRCSHNPYSKSFMDLCDRYGILVVDELYDKWLTQYAGGRKAWSDMWQHDIEEWMKRDRNHPCVVMWSLGNELQTLWEIPYHDYGVTPYRMQKALMDHFDRTRPVTVAMHPRGRNHATDSLPAPLALETDIASYNYRYMYFPGDSKRFPWMIFYQSEATAGGIGPNFFGMDLDRVVGLAYWGAIDYLGESQGWPVKGWDKGVFDIALSPKPQAWHIRSYFKPEEPLVRIAVMESQDNVMWNDVNVGTKRLVEHWNFKPESTLDMYTYTNADEVELFINGKSMGRKSNNRQDPAQRNAIKWTGIPYSKGSVKVVAYTDGKPTATHRLETTGKPVKLIGVPDKEGTEWKTDGMDLLHVKVSAVDSRNRKVNLSGEPLEFKVEGEADIVGVINGDLTSHELTVGNRRNLYQGEATVILRSRTAGGKVSLSINSKSFKPVKLDINH